LKAGRGDEWQQERGPRALLEVSTLQIKLADQGADTRLIQDYLGHRDIQHTVRYTAANRARFDKLRR
jgi:integrase